MAVSRGALRGALLSLLLLAAAQVPTFAATFGVPTQIGTDGRVCTGANAPAGIGCAAAAVDPPGYLILTGVDDVDAAGDTVHQMRLFIEVTGTTLDVRVFDPGRSGARDEELSANTTFTYALYNPAGGLVKSIAIGADAAGTTENRVARMSSAVADAAFVALNAGTAFTVTPGLYELRVTASGAGGGADQDDRNSFGVDIRSGTGAAAGHYNVYTYGLDDDAGQGSGAGATDTSHVIGALETGGNGGDISEDMIFYPYVTRGCSLATSNFDMDTQAGASTSITDTRGTNTALTVSGSTVHSENTVTIHAAAGVQNDVNNYGLFALQNDTGSQYNIIDWRVADFRGWADATTIPLDTTDALRTFLPNGYTGGVPPLTNATAPAEPVLAASYAYVSGRNPPAVGFLTRFVVQFQRCGRHPEHRRVGPAVLSVRLHACGPRNLLHHERAGGPCGGHLQQRRPRPQLHHLGPVQPLPHGHREGRDPGAGVRSPGRDRHSGDPSFPDRPAGRSRRGGGVRHPGPAPNRGLQPLRYAGPLGSRTTDPAQRVAHPGLGPRRDRAHSVPRRHGTHHRALHPDRGDRDHGANAPHGAVRRG